MASVDVTGPGCGGGHVDKIGMSSIYRDDGIR